jgi:hypothetical protein
MTSFLNFLTGNGEVYLPNKFLSARFVKEALDKKFNVLIVEETSDYIKLKIIRWIRLYGAPFIWPQASIRIWIDNEDDKLIFKFSCPEYLALIIPYSFFFIFEQRIREVFPVLGCALIFFSILMFLDTKWVSRRVRKAFEGI